MTQPTEPARIAVLDMGKTRLKLLVASEDGWPLETRSIPNTANNSGPYLAYDLARLEEWFLDTLAKAGIVHVGREHVDDLGDADDGLRHRGAAMEGADAGRMARRRRPGHRRAEGDWNRPTA